MAFDTRRIVISGRLGAAPEQRFLQDGTPILAFRAAVNQGKESTGWYSCSVFGKQATTLAPMLAKGSRVIVDGKLELREFTGNDGSKRLSADIRVDDLTLLDPKGANGGDGGQPSGGRPSQGSYAQGGDFNSDEDIPF